MLNGFRKSNEKGFTLIELLIVVAIIGILAAVAIPQFAAYRIKGYDSASQSDVKNLATAEASFFADWQGFGVTLEGPIAGAGVTSARVAAGTAIAGATATGGNGAPATDYIGGQDAASTDRSLQIGVSNGVVVIANSSGPFDSFTAISKHTQGRTTYGLDSDVTSLYQDPSTVAIGTALVVGSAVNLASVINADDFNGQQAYVVK